MSGLALRQANCSAGIGMSLLPPRSSLTQNRRKESEYLEKTWCCIGIEAAATVWSVSAVRIAARLFIMASSRTTASAVPTTGWKYDACGKCIEQPFENPEAGYKDKIQHPAYPVVKLSGLLFAYMGPPEKKPNLPKWDILVRRDGVKKVDICEVLQCNWLQAMENSVDPTHTYYLHSHTLKLKGAKDFVPFHYQTLSKIDFELVIEPNWAGIQKQRVFAGDEVAVEAPHPLIFPNILFVPVRSGYALHFRTPINDLNTQVYQFRFSPTKDGSIPEQPKDPSIEYVGTKNADGEFHLDNFASQDHMAWETQGPIADRAIEHLGEGDRGVIMFRKLLRDQIQAVQNGQDPAGTSMDPTKDEMIQLIHEGYSAFSFAAAQEQREA
jgi:5,5'-dehydrodivanillate O-demethylase